MKRKNYILSHINKNNNRFDLLNKLNSSINDSSKYLRFFVVSSAITITPYIPVWTQKEKKENYSPTIPNIGETIFSK